MPPEYYREYREKNKERIYGVRKSYREGDKREEILEKKRRWHAGKVDRYWMKVVEGYGGACIRCPELRPGKEPENDPNGLLVHHVEGDGRLHRRSVGATVSWRFHRWIIENMFPKEIELLCGTCHLILHRSEKFKGWKRREETE